MVWVHRTYLANAHESSIRKGTIAWVPVLVGHLAVIWFVGHATEDMVARRPSIEPMVLISMAPVVRGSITTSFPLQLLPAGPIVSDLPKLSDMEEPSIAPQSSGHTIPPHPAESQVVRTAEFAHDAGLKYGSGATVVLRVEVRGSGLVGRVEIDASSGNRRVNQAAIAYVRALKWVGGRIDDKPETIWIRWGVRLDG
jgi:TonB family protein